jgi:hypothetical protein
VVGLIWGTAALPTGEDEGGVWGFGQDEWDGGEQVADAFAVDESSSEENQRRPLTALGDGVSIRDRDPVPDDRDPAGGVRAVPVE